MNNFFLTRRFALRRRVLDDSKCDTFGLRHLLQFETLLKIQNFEDERQSWKARFNESMPIKFQSSSTFTIAIKNHANLCSISFSNQPSSSWGRENRFSSGWIELNSENTHEQLSKLKQTLLLPLLWQVETVKIIIICLKQPKPAEMSSSFPLLSAIWKSRPMIYRHNVHLHRPGELVIYKNLFILWYHWITLADGKVMSVNVY